MAAIQRVHPVALSGALGRIASKAGHQSRLWSFDSAFTGSQLKGHGQCFHVADLSRSVARKRANQYTCYSTLQTLAAPVTVTRTSQNVGQTYIEWWSQKLQQCRKPLTKEMMKRLKFSNPLGLDESLRGGSLKKGTKSAELLEMKASFPREIFLCRTGDIYEAVGVDACIVVEYVGVAPVGRKDSVPKAGCPIVNLRQAIDELTQEGFSVCVVEEVQGGATGRGRRRERFIAGHAHPGSPYVYGLAAQNVDLEFPDAVSVVGISHSGTGYCLIFASEIMRTFAVEDGLTEEAAVALLRAQRCHKLYTHISLQFESAGNGSWGRRGLLWSVCENLQHEWYEDDPVDDLLCKVREIYGLDESAEFREILVPPGERPRPLYIGTASQIGIIPQTGVPSLLNVVLPKEAHHLCVSYLKNLLLHPPPHRVSECIQGACAGLEGLSSSVPDFTCVSAAKLKRLIEAKEVNHVELSRIQRLAEDVLYMSNDPQLTGFLDLLLEPAWLATGLRIGRKQLVADCKMLTSKLGQMLASEGDLDQARSQGAGIPDDFFRDLEDTWRGRVRREHAEEVYREVDEAANELITAVNNDFCPIVSHTDGDNGKGLKIEVCYSYEDQAVWLQGKNLKSLAGSDGSVGAALKCLVPAVDAKGKKVGEEWWTTSRVESSLSKYRAAVENASVRVLEILRAIAEDLQPKTEVLIFVSTLSVIAKTLYMHVTEGARRNWVVPTLSSTERQMVLDDLVPYWNDPAHENVQPNMVQMKSMFLLTGPNGGGKSSMLRSICAGALLATCGLMVPARQASVPRFDAIILRMMSTDSPADGKSAFQMEMAELKTILAEATDKSLVLVDELCRGTDVGKGSFIAASVIETLDRIGCIGVLSTHLHDLLDMELRTSNVVQKAMGTNEVDGRYYPTWKLADGACRESLAFEVARKEGVPADVVDRAEELCVTKMLYPNGLHAASQDDGHASEKEVQRTDDERMTAEKLFLMIARFVIKFANSKP